MKLKLGKNKETFKKHRHSQFPRIALINFIYKKVIYQSNRNNIHESPNKT